MKMKYYMRGLGIGIIVTVLLMDVALSGRKESMTDEEIRQRALEMGMVEEDGGVLADDLGTDEAETLEEGDQTISENETVGAADPGGQEELSEPEGQETVQDGLSSTDETAAEPSAQEPSVTEPSAMEEDSVTIVVYSGDGSRRVADRLKEAGVIEDAEAFDVFLCQNGYDKRIAAGEHEIPPGATEQEIAEALTR